AANSLLNSPSVGGRDRELATILDEDLDRFQSLVSDAIQMLRIDAGDFAVHRERHNLRSIIDATLRRFEHRLDGHQFVDHVGEGLTVDADRGPLELALRQLLDNALKYSPPTSTIELQAQSNGVVEISVWNSGSTIPESERPRVVERFYRGSRARNIPGTGMGLTIVQQIARSHGGSLTLTSTPDTGTAFTLSLPRGESHE